MRTVIVFAIVALISQSVHAQSKGNARLGNFSQPKRTAYPSIKDQQKAGKFAAQARARTGANRKGRGWVGAGSGSWLHGNAQ